jgi:3-phosphoshikimate 1-carboxyvinyltransferase
MGVPIASEPEGEGERIRFEASTWSGDPLPLTAEVPGDLSSAAFVVVGGLLLGRRLTIRGVGLNPSRAGFLEVLARMGADVSQIPGAEEAGEPRGDLSVRADSLGPFSIEEGQVPGLVDEVPALAVLACRVGGVSEIRGAAELRVKESDRLRLLASNLQVVGVRCEELDDGLRIYGTDAPLRGSVRTGGDHRIAMAFGVLGASPNCEIEIDDRDCVRVSYPGFWADIGRLTKQEA